MNKIASIEHSAQGLALLILIAGWAVAYFVWPDGVTEILTAQATIGSALRELVAGAIAFGATAICLVGMAQSDHT
jgi:hypothetical protein